MSTYNVAEAKNQLSRLIDAQRLGATLVTFDRRMADSARALGIAVAVP